MFEVSKRPHRAARLLMSMLFLTSGFGKLAAVEDTQKYMEAFGVPGYLIYPAAALEIGGGGMLVVGIHLRWLGQILAAWCVLTAITFHTDFADANQKINFLKNMAMAGGFLVLSATSTSEGGSLTPMQIKNKLQARVSQAVNRLRCPSGHVALSADSHIEQADFMEKGKQVVTDPGTTAKAKKEITLLLQCYRNALVESDSEAVMKLYASDSVLMAQTFPSVYGWKNIKYWYEECFKRIALEVEFEIKEVVVISDEYAFASTTSAGTQKDLESDVTSREGNHELFVIQKEKGDWKLARYCFSTTNPAE